MESLKLKIKEMSERIRTLREIEGLTVEELAKKTITLLNNDYENNQAFHEYYHPETGEGVFNKGFSSWNALVANMIAYLENKEVIEEWNCP